MTNINATPYIPGGAAASLPIDYSGPVQKTVTVVTANSGTGSNPTPDQGTPPAVLSKGLGMSNQTNPTTAAFEAGNASFADSNKFDPATTSITPVPLNDGGYTLGPNGPGIQEKQARQPQGGAQFESAAPAAAVQPMASGPGAVFVDGVSPIKDNLATTNEKF